MQPATSKRELSFYRTNVLSHREKNFTQQSAEARTLQTVQTVLLYNVVHAAYL